MSAAPAAPPAEPSAETLFDGLAVGEPAAAPKAPHAVAVSGDLVVRLSALVEARQFVEAIALAETVRRAVAADPRLRRLLEQAHTRLEAEPYLKTFLDSARQALQAGETDEFERLLRKARALDPTHPGLADLEEAKAFYADPDPAPSPAGGRALPRPTSAATSSCPSSISRCQR